jgi:hypothetical protein
MDAKNAIKKLEDQFGGRLGLLVSQIVTLSATGQPCDVTFYDRKPALSVTILPAINAALMYGVGTEKLAEMLQRIELSNGMAINLVEIWTINHLPKDGLTEEQLAAVDLADAEEKVGPAGETLRKMIRDTYHCKNQIEEDRFLRRYIAS